MRNSEKKHLRVYTSPMGCFEDSSKYKFIAEFEDPYVAGEFVREARISKCYPKNDIIIQEVPANEQSYKGKIVCVLSVMGEYLPVEEYEFI